MVIREGKKRINLIKLFGSYTLVGVINTIVGIGTIFLLTFFLNLEHIPATFIGNSVGVVLSFILNRKYTFQDKGNIPKTLILFVSVSLTCYFISYIYLHKHLINMLTQIAPKYITEGGYQKYFLILFEAGLYTVLSFLLHKLITFKRRTVSQNDKMK